jgi:hypothetical protein
MLISVEPRDGHELDRLITVLLNATGVVHRVIEATERPPEADGEAVIGLLAEWLHGALAVLAEHRDEKELRTVTEVLAEATVLVARSCLDPRAFDQAPRSGRSSANMQRGSSSTSP